MLFKEQIQHYQPINEQEAQDQRVILSYIEHFPHNILTRENEFAHITCSSFIFNQEKTKALMIHHNIYKTWSWTGGHADGETDFLHVAIKEAQEETGITKVKPLSRYIASIDIIPVLGHIKKGFFVSPHLHLNVSYLLEADEHESLIIKEDENSDVKWIPLDEISTYSNEPNLIYIYNKLITKAKERR